MVYSLFAYRNPQEGRLSNLVRKLQRENSLLAGYSEEALRTICQKTVSRFVRPNDEGLEILIEHPDWPAHQAYAAEFFRQLVAYKPPVVREATRDSIDAERYALSALVATFTASIPVELSKASKEAKIPVVLEHHPVMVVRAARSWPPRRLLRRCQLRRIISRRQHLAARKARGA